MVEMMNNQLPAYLTFYLDDLGMDKDFIRKLLTRACCPELIHEIYSCQWDKETKVLTTPGEEEDEKIMQILRVLLGTVTRLENIWWNIRKRVKGNMQHQRLSTI